MRTHHIKDCKKKTPDGTIKSKDVVTVHDVICTVNGTKLSGEFIFDSYDDFDGSCYVYRVVGMTYNIPLDKIKSQKD